MNDDTGWEPIALKRDWVPEWLWRALGQAPVRYRVIRWVLTRATSEFERRLFRA